MLFKGRCDDNYRFQSWMVLSLLLLDKPKDPPVIDANGDGLGRYGIYQLDSKGVYQKVGFCHAGKPMNLDIKRIRYKFFLHLSLNISIVWVLMLEKVSEKIKCGILTLSRGNGEDYNKFSLLNWTF